MRPQIHRKNVIVKNLSTVQIVVKPSVAQTTELRTIKQTKTITKKIERQPPVNNGAAVSRSRNPVKRELKRKKPNIKYTTNDISPESLHKINKIRDHGRGKVLIIIGNGPSINEAPLQRLKNIDNIDTLSINKPDSRLWPTTHWAFFDISQFKRHKILWDSYKGVIFNSTAIKEQHDNSMQFKNLGGQIGFSRDLSKGIRINRSSVYASMQIALWMNYDHVYIFGCDMNPDGIDGKLHFYGINPDVDPKLRATRFEKEAVAYDHAASFLTDKERSKYTFCTEYNNWSFVQSFNQMSHKTAVDYIIKQHTK